VSVIFPLLIENKVDHPDRVIALQGILSKYYTTAEEANLKRDAINELYDLYIVIKENKITGVHTELLVSNFPTVGDIHTSYKAVKEPITNDNGYYHYEVGVGYVKDISDISERTERIAADAILQNNIDAEVNNRQLADGYLEEYIDNETNSRINSYTILEANINAEVATRLADDNTLQSNINANDRFIGFFINDNVTPTLFMYPTNTKGSGAYFIKKRLSDSAIELNIWDDNLSGWVGLGYIKDINTSLSYLNAVVIENDLKSDNADTILQANIDAEGALRGTGDLDAQANLDSETLARLNADAVIQANIDAEAATRLAKDNTLQGNIDSLTTDESLYRDGNIFRSNISDFTEQFTWHTAASTSFVLSFEPTYLQNICINGTRLFSDVQYSVTLPNIINILSALADGDVITIQYQHKIT